MKLYLRILRYAKPYLPRIIISILCMMIVSACTAGSMYLMKPLFDEGFAASNPNAFKSVKTIAALLLGIYLVKGLAFYIQDYLMNNAGQKMVMDIKNGLYAHVQKLSLGFFSRNKTGQILSRLTSDVTNMQSAVNASTSILSNSLTFLGLLAVVIRMNWFLTVVSLAISSVIVFPLYKFGKRLRNVSSLAQNKIGEITSVAHEGIANVRIVKAFGMEEYEQRKYEQANRGYFDTFMKGIRTTAMSTPIVDYIGITAICAIIIISGHQVSQKLLTIGEFMAFTGALFLLFNPIKNLNGVNMVLQQAFSSAERVFELLDTPVDVKDREGALELKEFENSLEFKGVSFSYNPGAEVLKNINLSIKKGQVVAIVGPSGSGKSTLVDLIPRFYDVAGGSLEIDGKDIRGITLKSLRAQIGIVTQETILFNDSVRNNIAYGLSGAAQEKVEEAAKAANAHAFILKTQQGYDTFIGERGVKLSGGERQRLSIARAVMKNPPILILDEATSALDSESERLVQDALNNLMKNRTTIVIAHRMSTIINADKIVVLKNGLISAEGKHEELLKTSETYKRLYEMQFADGRVKEK